MENLKLFIAIMTLFGCIMVIISGIIHIINLNKLSKITEELLAMLRDETL